MSQKYTVGDHVSYTDDKGKLFGIILKVDGSIVCVYTEIDDLHLNVSDSRLSPIRFYEKWTQRDTFTELQEEIMAHAV